MLGGYTQWLMFFLDLSFGSHSILIPAHILGGCKAYNQGSGVSSLVMDGKTMGSEGSRSEEGGSDDDVAWHSN